MVNKHLLEDADIDLHLWGVLAFPVWVEVGRGERAGLLRVAVTVGDQGT
jgi:hypothetical protein